MPNFKPKHSKIINVDEKTKVTLDSKHNEIIEEFNKNKKIIHNYKINIQELQKKLIIFPIITILIMIFQIIIF